MDSLAYDHAWATREGGQIPHRASRKVRSLFLPTVQGSVQITVSADADPTRQRRRLQVDATHVRHTTSGQHAGVEGGCKMDTSSSERLPPILLSLAAARGRHVPSQYFPAQVSCAARPVSEAA